MGEVIKSSQNSTVKRIKSLQLKKFRDEYEEFIIEGRKLIEEALQYGAGFSFAAVSEDYLESGKLEALDKRLAGAGIPVYCLDERLFREISDTATPQGILAVVKKPEYRLETVLRKERLNLVVLAELRDPGNLGTIIRTADACGIDGVILSNGCVDVYNGKVVRSTMGSLFHLPVIQNVDLEELIHLLHKNEINTIGADPHGEMSCVELPAMDRNAIIIGNESAGLDQDFEQKLDHIVKIPMPGKAESLNAGIAAALLMYEVAVRKRI